MFPHLTTPISAMEGRVFRNKWRNPLLKTAIGMTTAIAAGLLASVIVSELLLALFGTPPVFESEWANYAFGGACGWMGWYFVNKRRKDST